MKKSFEKKIISESKHPILKFKRIPKKYKDDVHKLYSFFYVTSSYSHANDPDNKKLMLIIKKWQQIKRDDSFSIYKASDDSIGEKALQNMAYLVNRYDINLKDIDDYFRSLAIKIRAKQLYTSQDYVRFIHYSAEAPALIIAKVLQLPNALTHNAKMFARAIYVIDSLTSLNKTDSPFFLPKSELKKFELESLKISDIKNNHDALKKLILLQISRYRTWQEESKKGDEFLPKKLKPLIVNTRKRYDYLAKKIEKDPFCIINDVPKVPSNTELKVRTLFKK